MVFSLNCFAASAARADVTVVSEITVTGAPKGITTQAGDPLSKPIVSTSFYKNNKHRTETLDTIILFDGDTSTTLTLNRQSKTYTEVKGPEGAASGAGGAMNPLLGQMKFSVKTFVKPGGQTQTIAGRVTKNTKFTAIMKMGMATADAPAVMAQMLPTITLQGEEWMADGLMTEAQKLGPTNTVFAGMAEMNSVMGPGLKDFAAKMEAIKGFPLASTLSTRVTFPEGAAAAMGASVPAQPVVVTMRAKSVSTEPLDDALFVVPSDYKKVDAAPLPDTNPAPTKVL